MSDTIVMCSQTICDERYEIHRYHIPRSFTKKMKLLRKYFKSLVRNEIPRRYMLRKNAIEYTEVAVMILARSGNLLCSLDIPFAVGSRYLAAHPWAIFGDAPEVRGKYNFRDFDDIADHYFRSIVQGSSYHEYVHFRVEPTLPLRLADRHERPPHFIVAVAVSLLFDLIVNCGPDCKELRDIFTNDVRELEDFDLENWIRLRFHIMGSRGATVIKPYDVEFGQVYDPPIQFTSSVRIQLISEIDDFSNEKSFT